MQPGKRLIQELEETVVDAWPVPVSEELDGWLLRQSGGPSKRGNSVAPLASGRELELDERIARAERWYEAHGQRAIFQVGPCAAPADLDSVLAARGYTVAGAAQLARVDPEELLARPLPALEVRVEAQPKPHFRAVVQAASRFAATERTFFGVLANLGSRCRYATAFDGAGEPVACCVGIASEDRLGVYAMVTRPEARRTGAARALLRALAKRALTDAARELYLLVDVDNAPARALYASMGFRDVYPYHYRVAPTPEA
jgi:N-acetylglutamate synthase